MNTEDGTTMDLRPHGKITDMAWKRRIAFSLNEPSEIDKQDLYLLYREDNQWGPGSVKQKDIYKK